jgi:hypothetical protein
MHSAAEQRDIWDKTGTALSNPYVLAIIVFVMAMITCFSAQLGFDESIWTYMARMWINYDLPPYSGTVENKTPGIYVVFAISNLMFGFNIWFPKLLSALVITGSALNVYAICNKLYSRFAAVLGMLLFAVIMTSPVVDARYVFTETFMVLFITSSIAAVIHSAYKERIASSRLWLFLAGFLIGCAVLFKQIAVLDIAAVLVFYLSIYKSKRNRWVADISVFLAGLAVAFGLCLLMLVLSDIRLKDFKECVWTILTYSGSTRTEYRLARLKEALGHSEFVIYFFAATLFVINRNLIRQKNIPYIGLIFWMLTDVFAANAPGMYWAHHLQQIVPSLSVMSGIIFGLLIQEYIPAGQKQKKFFTQIVLGIIVVGIQYETLFGYILHGKIMYHIDPRMEETQKAGLFFKSITEPDDYICVLAENAPAVYAYADRRAPGRHFLETFLNKPEYKQEMKEALIARPPKLLVIQKNPFTKVWFAEFMRKYKYKSGVFNANIKYRCRVFERGD